MIYGAEDKRSPNWMTDALPKGMPPGDSLMVVDLDLHTTAVEVDTASPNHSIQLVSLKSIISEKGEYFEASMRLNETRTLDLSDARALELEDILKSPLLTTLQRIRLEHLYEQERRGLSSAELWQALGTECVVDGISSLRELEGTLAASCAEELMANALGSASHSPDTAQALLSFVSKCQTKGGWRETPFRHKPKLGNVVHYRSRTRDTRHLRVFGK